MRRIYEPGSLHEGELLLAVLASEGISGFLAGRHLLGGIGDCQRQDCSACWSTTRRPSARRR